MQPVVEDCLRETITRQVLVHLAYRRVKQKCALPTAVGAPHPLPKTVSCVPLRVTLFREANISYVPTGVLFMVKLQQRRYYCGADTCAHRNASGESYF